MTKANLTTTINQHVYTADGVRYRVNLAMVAREPLWSGATRYLCAVEVRADGPRQPSVIYVLIGTRVPRDEVIRLVEEALLEHLTQQPARQLHVSPALSGSSAGENTSAEPQRANSHHSEVPSLQAE